MPVYYEDADDSSEGIFAVDFSAISVFYSNGTLRNPPYSVKETPLDVGYTITSKNVLLATVDRGVVAVNKGEFRKI